ncbi:MAG: cytochrome c maturation protein CcmE [Magnetospiraceae bacterium]
MKRKHKRLSFLLIALLLLGGAAALVLTAFEDNIVFFFSPTELAAKEDIGPDRRIRIGGLVGEDSVSKDTDGVTTHFIVTDMETDLKVSYRGILPDLFREGQGVVAEGRFIKGVFVADEVLAKHDENYMPPEVADALKKSGNWQEGQGSMGEAAPYTSEGDGS